MLLNSIGGGTGLGLGSLIIQTLNDYFPRLFKFTVSIFPSKDDDVIISSYNSILLLNKLIENADCVLFMDNQSMLDICKKVEFELKTSGNLRNITENAKMNNIISQVLCNLTCSMRFERTLNVNMNDITMNLVPFPRLHFIIPAISPLYHVIYKKLIQIFSDVFNRDHQLISVDNFSSDISILSVDCQSQSIADININLNKQRKNLKMEPRRFQNQTM